MSGVLPASDVLLPGAVDSPETISYWCEDIHKYDVVSEILKTKAFRRLQDISFLGALDYTHPGTEKLGKRYRSRAMHSLHVAALANFVSQLREYPTELTVHVIVAALLHDVGHAPLSHSVEPYIKATLGYGHHEAGCRVIRGEAAIGRELHSVLCRYVDVELVLALIDGTAAAVDGGELFSSPLNIDTIDGIARSHAYLTDRRSNQCVLSVARSAFGSDAERDFSVLDRFWEMKHRVYANLINEKFGVIADKASELFFDEHGTFTDEDIYDTERAWQRKHSRLFSSFDSLLKDKVAPSWMAGSGLTVTDRRYYIDDSRLDHDRFVCEKYRRVLAFDLGEPVEAFDQGMFDRF